MSDDNGSTQDEAAAPELPPGIVQVITLTRNDKNQLAWSSSPKIEDMSVYEYAFKEAADWLEGDRLARQNAMILARIAQENRETQMARQLMGGKRMGGPGLIQS